MAEHLGFITLVAVLVSIMVIFGAMLYRRDEEEEEEE